jgi:hypothetical protein
MSKIVTNTEKTINDTIESGQVVRNGAGRGFELEVGETDVTLKPINDVGGKTVVLSRKVFAQLYYRNNYVQVPKGVDPLKDSAVSASVGGNRFLLK